MPSRSKLHVRWNSYYGPHRSWANHHYVAPASRHDRERYRELLDQYHTADPVEARRIREELSRYSYH